MNNDFCPIEQDDSLKLVSGGSLANAVPYAASGVVGAAVGSAGGAAIGSISDKSTAAKGAITGVASPAVYKALEKRFLKAGTAHQSLSRSSSGTELVGGPR